ncbi:MAG: sigma-54-dependent Fis family transcriptional regulator [Nitrospiraceae bacterium]|nr:MAG: sigma-54-dependent Fis family transcriptional regulator [Nitrospiraceae bacterium]
MKSKYKANVLLVDDEPNALRVLSAILNEASYNTSLADGVDKALGIVSAGTVDAVITDLKMPGKDGLYLFHHLKANYPDIPVIFLTAFGTVDSAVTAMTEGAFFYFIKPPDYIKLKAILDKAVEQRRLKYEIAELRSQLESTYGFSSIIGKSPGMEKVFRMVETIRDSSTNVLITGETGTGKELLAKAIHYTSRRHYRPFIAVNCAAVPGELLEAEFFGHERGSFTGAVSRRIGKFEEANTGTLFLDEIGELELSLQAKILRAIQEKEIERIGGNRKIKIDIRLIASTNRELVREVKLKNFRADLYYRLNVVQIKLPPLRERISDIPLLVTHFIDKFSQRENRRVSAVSPEAMNVFLQHDWPGNLRELENIIERAVVLAKKDMIGIKDLPHEIRKEIRAGNLQSNALKPLKEMEAETIIKAINIFNGNKSKAAAALGITRKALYSRLGKAGHKHSGKN